MAYNFFCLSVCVQFSAIILKDKPVVLLQRIFPGVYRLQHHILNQNIHIIEEVSKNRYILRVRFICQHRKLVEETAGALLKLHRSPGLL